MSNNQDTMKRAYKRADTARRENTRDDGDEPQRAMSRGAERALIILAVLGCGAVLWAAQDILVPTAAAVVVAMALSPIVILLERAGLPTAVSSFVAVLLTAAVIAGSAALIAPGFHDWIKRAPEIAQTLEQKARPLKEWLATLQQATAKLEEVTQVAPGVDGSRPVVPVQTSTGSILETAPEVLAQVGYVLVLALFLLSVRHTYRKRLILLPRNRENRLRVARIMNETLTQVSNYLFTTTMINIGLGVATTIAFMILGVPYAVVWGFVFGAASFIPYVGPTVTIALCAVAQLVTAPTLGDALAPPLVLLAFNTIESNFVTPMLLARRLEVSSLAVFLTVALFAWLWGPIAAIVAVPLLSVFSAVARHVPGLEPWAVLLLAESETKLEVKETARDKFFADHPPTPAETDGAKAKWVRWVKEHAPLKLPVKTSAERDAA